MGFAMKQAKEISLIAKIQGTTYKNTVVKCKYLFI
jgi:hypothetical protein